jgi:hypothetical protein
LLWAASDNRPRDRLRRKVIIMSFVARIRAGLLGGVSRIVRRVAGVALIAALTIPSTLSSPASAAVPGLDTFVSFSDENSASIKTERVFCPDGMRLVGAGGGTFVGGNEVRLTRVRPIRPVGVSNGLPIGVEVQAEEDTNGFADNWSLGAIATCANSLPGLQLVTSPASAERQPATADCPAGKQLIGVGGEIDFGSGVSLEALYPNPDGLEQTVVSAHRRPNFSNSNSWRVTAHAICANPLPGLQRVTMSSPFQSTGAAFTSVSCPDGKVLLSAGGDLSSGTSGQVTITFSGLVSFGGPGSAWALAEEDEDGFNGKWLLRARGICANP